MRPPTLWSDFVALADKSVWGSQHSHSSLLIRRRAVPVRREFGISYLLDDTHSLRYVSMSDVTLCVSASRMGKLQQAGKDAV
jgi:hypothetical protein